MIIASFILSIIATLASVAAVVTSFILFGKSVYREMYEPLNDVISKFLLEELPDGLHGFIDFDNHTCAPDIFDDNISKLLPVFCKKIKSLDYLEHKKYRCIIKAITEFEDACIAYANKGKLDDDQVNRYQDLIKKIYTELKKLYSKC
ncbi:MAG: hypothetical protein GX638_14160 [Crenarchaeota archaeon]|nr:hypothetical protein [Thermoproteota archaeon]